MARKGITVVTLVSALCSLTGVALAVNAAVLLTRGLAGDALLRGGMGLYCCALAFVRYDAFIRMARQPVSLAASAERTALARLFPARVMPAVAIAFLMMVAGTVVNMVAWFR
ncbi:hypothetical protein [Massilia sp. DWR3-1-1]|uniref:hypothetical protein n=1 Tax=Massilia sp. DWR3-1-1 TaxID=2804559 RepID=UPI003CE81583